MKFRYPKLLLILLTAVVFFSCNKGSDSEYYVKLKINGNWETWKTAAGELGPDFANPAKTDLGVTGWHENGKDIFDLTIQINGSNFATGAYDSDNTTYWVDITYSKDITTANAKSFYIQSASGRPDSKYTVTITSITDTELRGTFTGNYLHESFDDESLELTEGEFRVKRAR